MATSAEQIRRYGGPALFSYGFRPFFLFGSLWSAIALPLFVAAMTGRATLPATLPPVIWHMHEMIYGYVPAIVAGFLLTAVPNWTGRLPVVGLRLAALFAIWVAGRIAMLSSLLIGPTLAAAVDVAFLAALGVIVGREILAAGSTRNVKVLGLIVLLAAGNATSHVEAITGAGNLYGIRLGIAGTILLIALIGGRIVPSFTRNWLAKRSPGSLPAPFSRFDVGVTVVTALALAAWTLDPTSHLTGAASLAAMLANLWRLARWSGQRTFAEPLVLVLHVAFAFVPVGFGLVAVSVLWPAAVTPSGALHGWTAGAIGMMTLAVMTRASLGHTGQPLTATRTTTGLYLAVALAAGARLAAAFHILPEEMLLVSMALWCAGFGGFVVTYGPSLTATRR